MEGKHSEAQRRELCRATAAQPVQPNDVDERAVARCRVLLPTSVAVEGFRKDSHTHVLKAKSIT